MTVFNILKIFNVKFLKVSLKLREEYGVGVLGYRFMGRTHSYAYKSLTFYYDPPLPKVNLVAIYGRNEEGVRAAANQFGYASYYTDSQRLIDDERIDIVDNCLPNFLHAKPSIMALEKGKHVICEKPLATNLEEAKEMVRVAEKAEAKSMVQMCYRFLPAVQRAKKLIDEGYIGKIYQFRGAFLHMGHVNPKRPLSWREQKSLSGGGALADLGIHVVDLARFLVGDVRSLCAVTKTFIKKRPLPGEDRMGEVTVDDAGLILLEFKNGALGSIEASRFSTGHKNPLRIEVHGSEGAIAWDVEKLNVLQFYSLKDPYDIQGWRHVMVDVPVWPPRGHIVGWVRGHVGAIHHFLECLVNDRKPEPSFESGMRAQEILEATYISAEEKKYVDLPL